jgi:hypothetical protein
MDFSTQLDDLQQPIDQAKVDVDHKATKAGPVLGRRNLLRTGFGGVLFVAWGILTILWVASTLYSVANGNLAAAVTAVPRSPCWSCWASWKGWKSR